MQTRPLLAANWKMHGTEAQLRAWCAAYAAQTDEVAAVEMVLFPPFVWLPLLREIAPPFAWGAQSLGPAPEGAFTGEVSAAMLGECGCRYVLVGHSERRRLCAETDETAAQRLRQALDAGLRPVLCVGETLEERRTGQGFAVVERQLRGAVEGAGGIPADSGAVLAYEPVWAIGSGQNATAEQAREMHGFLRRLWGELDTPQAPRILYGGSVNADNAADFAALEEVDGVLVGGASLQAAEFSRICSAFSRRK